MAPRRAQVELDPGYPHEQHDGPPSDAVERADNLWREDRRVIARKCRAEHAGAEQDAADDLHDHQRRPIIGPPQAPDEIGHGEDDDHRHQKQFGCAHTRRAPSADQRVDRALQDVRGGQ